jgi:hypothetical protein
MSFPIYPGMREVRVPRPAAPASTFGEHATIPDMIELAEYIYVVHGTTNRAHFNADRSGRCSCGMLCTLVEDWPAHMEAAHGSDGLMQEERMVRIKRACDEYSAKKMR